RTVTCPAGAGAAGRSGTPSGESRGGRGSDRRRRKRPIRSDGEAIGSRRPPTTVRARSRSRRKQVHCHLTHRTPAAPVLFRNGLAQREPPGDWGKSTPAARQTLCQRQTRGVEEFACTLAIRDRAVSV